ncbi:hypothetical protein IST4116A_01213 [Burkholderia cenocepacia]|uniref:hypothetical protein n=1 Tax=Burkholderia cenocepacia TaxID=95486 RepID=UPI0019B3EDDC|nr:hypothetical protein [Burkholderia cenocepacia]MCW3657551.1 hypothetical protein [Burkholderia cenocepacia]CAB5083075.1 hypothetical protein IST4116B_01205 [Burkholderia cenocepacia]CAB5083758.1 hypothetical protein IST4134_01214 [Burkholderia cenocepacia]CAB5087839.1 hypothetical protein IST4113_01212 [Burkholderia cenocepacia]CAB5095871.1 hypothetical protein IST439_01252 [Burkholderia cenocepacia]
MPDIPITLPPAVAQAAAQQPQQNLTDVAKAAAGKKKKGAPGKTAAQVLYPSLPSGQDVSGNP